jgi:hypothetical protein
MTAIVSAPPHQANSPKNATHSTERTAKNWTVPEYEFLISNLVTFYAEFIGICNLRHLHAQQVA